jgi:3-mercaptopyruvate sulfurtransferase SseA
MSKGLRYGCLVAAAGCLLVAQPLIAAEGITGHFVDVRWLKQHRHDPDVLILDGGMSKWEEVGLPVTTDATPAPKQGSFRVKAVNENVRVRLPEFLTASGEPANNVLPEALGANWHHGEVAPFNRAGHPPTGVLLPGADLSNPDKTFKSPVELRRMLRYMSQLLRAVAGASG